MSWKKRRNWLGQGTYDQFNLGMGEQSEEELDKNRQDISIT